ncbi:MAG TPA: hypothetical protein DCF33_00510 [Saprospirales bacterium]|nr:hypothetical protein [Saprospirales bacterium]
MKHNYLLISLLLICTKAFSQPLIWVNPIQSATDSPDETGITVLDVAVSPDGNTYVAGICTYPCAFAQGVAVTPDAGGQSLFIAKYKSNGQFEWVKDLGTLGEHAVHIVAPSLDGVYLATSFSVSSVDLGNGFNVFRSCTGQFCENALIAKFGPSGETIWAKTYEGSNIGLFWVSGIEQNAAGQLMVCIDYDSEMLDLGPGFVFNNLPSAGFFFSIIEANSGATVDVRFPGTFVSIPFTQSLAFNQNGQGVITGLFYEQISFTNGPTLTTTNDETSAYFAAGIDGTGNVQWARKINSSDYMDILAAEVDNEAATYLAIDASEDLLLDNSSILSINTSYAGAVLKLNNNSFSIPVFIPYDTDDYAIMDVEVDQWGIIYTVGYTSGDIQFGNDLVETNGCVDALLTQTSNLGLPISARSIGGGGCEVISNGYYGSCIDLDMYGFLYGAGSFLFNFNEDGFNFNGRGGFVTKINTSIVSVNEPEFASVDIFPNPSTGTFTVNLPEMPPSDALISISNTQGQEVFRQTANQQEIGLETSLSAGMYLITVTDGKRIYRGKIQII